MNKVLLNYELSRTSSDKLAIDRHLLILAISFPGVEWCSGVPGLQVVTQL
jgi:hypothetical protein